MVKAVVLYGPPEEPDAFERHYADTPNDGILASWSCWTSSRAPVTETEAAG